MKAILYLRVSSSSQVGNTSTGTQEEACRKWFEEHELDVDKIFIEAGESAKSEVRT